MGSTCSYAGGGCRNLATCVERGWYIRVTESNGFCNPPMVMACPETAPPSGSACEAFAFTYYPPSGCAYPKPGCESRLAFCEEGEVWGYSACPGDGEGGAGGEGGAASN